MKRELQLSFEQSDDSLLAIVREGNLNPTILAMVSVMSISSDRLLEVEFKGIMLAHVRRVVAEQGYDIEEVKTREEG